MYELQNVSVTYLNNTKDSYKIVYIILHLINENSKRGISLKKKEN